jgi:hypothetical protein
MPDDIPHHPVILRHTPPRNGIEVDSQTETRQTTAKRLPDQTQEIAQAKSLSLKTHHTPPLARKLMGADRRSPSIPTSSPKLNRILSILILFASFFTIRHASAPDKQQYPPSPPIPPTTTPLSTRLQPSETNSTPSQYWGDYLGPKS